MIHVCSQKELFNSLVAKEEEIAKMVDGLTCEVIDPGTVQGYRKRWDSACSGGSLVCPEGTVQSYIYKGARQRRMPDPSATRRRHS